jgi:hypothetical protein
VASASVSYNTKEFQSLSLRDENLRRALNSLYLAIALLKNYFVSVDFFRVKPMIHDQGDDVACA